MGYFSPECERPAAIITHYWEEDAERRRRDEAYEREERRIERERELRAECESNRTKRELLESDSLQKVIADAVEHRLKYLIENEGEILIHAIELANDRKARYDRDFKEIIDSYLCRIEMHNYAVKDDYCVLTHQLETDLNSPKTHAEVRHIEGWRYAEHNVYSVSILGEITKRLPDGWGLMTEKVLDSMWETGRKRLYEAIRDDDSFGRAYTGLKLRGKADTRTDESDDEVTFWVESDGYRKICTLERGGRYSMRMADNKDYYPMLLVKRGKEAVVVPGSMADSFVEYEYVFRTYPDDSYCKILGDILKYASEPQKELLTRIAEGIRNKYKETRG